MRTCRSAFTTVFPAALLRPFLRSLYRPFYALLAVCLLGTGFTGSPDPPPRRPATTFWVSSEGDDENDGSEGAPWETLQHAADMADTPGDVVRVLDGSYRGFNSQHDGVTFRAHGQKVIVNLPGSYSGLDHINIEGNDDVVVEGFIVRDAPRAGIRVVNAERVIVRKNIVGPNGKWGIFSGFAPQIQVLDNVTFGSEEEHGIYLSNSDGPNDNLVVRGNESFDNTLNGIQFNGDCYAGGDGRLEGGVIERNVVHDNGAKGLSIISAPGVRIQNNIIYENRRGGAGAAGIHLVDEPDCGEPTTDAIVVNNTIVEPRMAGIRLNLGATDNVIFNNLIISGNPIADEVGGNAIDAASNLTRATTNGLFADAAAADFHLNLEGPAVDAGAASYEGAAAPEADFEGRKRPVGEAPDPGAYEGSDEELPVTLVAFNAIADGEDVVLNWQTASETGNAGFDVQQWIGEAFQTIGFVAGAGTTDEAVHYAYRVEGVPPGTHRFRLRQVDFDGAFAYSPEVEAVVTVAGAVLSPPYPNPFNPGTTVRFAVQQSQPVRLTLFDALGRRVQVLYGGTPAAGASVEVRIDGTALPSGTYFVVLRGEGIAATRRLTLIR